MAGRWTALDAALREGRATAPSEGAAASHGEEGEETLAARAGPESVTPAAGGPTEQGLAAGDPGEGAADNLAADPTPKTGRDGRRRTRTLWAIAASGAVLVAVAVVAVSGWFGGDDGGSVRPTRNPSSHGGITALCNAGTQGIGVIHNRDDRYSLGDYDVTLETNTCTDAEDIGWDYVQSFYVGPDKCVDVRVDGSAEGHRVQSGQWFFDETIVGVYNLNASNC